MCTSDLVMNISNIIFMASLDIFMIALMAMFIVWIYKSFKG